MEIIRPIRSWGRKIFQGEGISGAKPRGKDIWVHLRVRKETSAKEVWSAGFLARARGRALQLHSIHSLPVSNTIPFAKIAYVCKVGLQKIKGKWDLVKENEFLCKGIEARAATACMVSALAQSPLLHRLSLLLRSTLRKSPLPYIKETFSCHSILLIGPWQDFSEIPHPENPCCSNFPEKEEGMEIWDEKDPYSCPWKF